MVIYYLGQTRSMLTRPRKIKKEESAWLFVKRRYDFPLGIRKDLFANSNTGEGWVRSSSISLYHTHRIHACCVPCVDPVEGSSFAGYESCFHVVQHFTKNVWNLEDGWWRTGRCVDGWWKDRPVLHHREERLVNVPHWEPPPGLWRQEHWLGNH